MKQILRVSLFIASLPMIASAAGTNAQLSKEQHEANKKLNQQRLSSEIDEVSHAQDPSKNKGVCPPSGLTLGWPLGGTAYKDWMVMNYVDLDPTTGLKDYTNRTGANAQTYDGHRGLDIDVPSFRYMDNNFPVNASADGTVTEIYQSSYDRNLTCSTDQWNHVTLTHGNGFTTTYGHMKKNSVVVSVGQNVVKGQKLGVVGSSGCSTYPHLHLETIDCNGNVIEPLKEGMFSSPPTYTKSAPTTIMDTYIRQPVVTSISQLQDPGTTEPTTVSAGVNFSVAMTVSHFKVGDSLTVEFYDPSNTLQGFSYSQTTSTFYPMSHWWGNFYLSTLGTWTMKYKVNGIPQATRTITVVP